MGSSAPRKGTFWGSGDTGGLGTLGSWGHRGRGDTGDVRADTGVPGGPSHLGPMRSPTKLISGYSSCGIITLSLTRVAGGLRRTR